MPSLQDGHRGPELMRDIGDDIAPELLLTGQGVGHPVEGGRQVA